jgi:hypothetical protein
MWEKYITTTATFYKKVTSSTLNDELKARAVSGFQQAGFSPRVVGATTTQTGLERQTLRAGNSSADRSRSRPWVGRDRRSE